MQGSIKPTHDTRLTICTADSRLSVNWKNESVTWGKLLNKCADTTRTDETIAEFQQLSTDKQGQIKDKGGFVGGQLTGNGQRKKANIVSRQVITLDADSVNPGTDFWQTFKSQFKFAACVYSTHKHTPERPRLRLIIPLSDCVGLEQWEAVSRYIAGKLDIEQFDKTTFQASRLMYWPTTSKDAEFYFEWQDGEILEASQILDEYENWQDIAQWPRHSKEAPETILRNSRKAPDPTEKNGIVGAFCSVYSIGDVLEKFLADVYEPTAQKDRYTYRKGSTSGGLVVYPDGYAFSNHSTDPAHHDAHGCNAFDLVRIHKFGALDDDKDEAKPMNRRHSFAEMERFALDDPAVRAYVVKKQTQDATDDFADVDINYIDDADKDEQEPKNNDWQSRLAVNRKMQVENTPTNIIAILLNDPELKKVKFDLFRNRDVSFSEKFINTKSHFINDESAGKISLYFYEKWKITISQGKIFEYLQTTAGARGFNPVHDFILRASWDGRPRIETALIDYLGAADTPLTRAITRKWFVGAVARAFNPGCKFDYILTVPGAQGIGKSTFFSIIGSKWFSDSFSFTAKDTAKFEAVISAWIIEISELSGLKRSEATDVKNFITKTSDTYRPAYGRTVEDYPRHCVFAATTNEDYFLIGDDGNRRWWIVKAEGKGQPSQWVDRLKANVSQMWAEAYHYFKEGENLFLTPELEAQANAVQFEYNKAGGDDLLPVIEEFLDVPLPVDWETYTKEEKKQYFKYYDPLKPIGTMKRQRVTAEVVKNELNDKRLDGPMYSAQRINALLERCEGWQISGSKQSPGKGYNRTVKVFHRVAKPPEDCI